MNAKEFTANCKELPSAENKQIGNACAPIIDITGVMLSPGHPERCRGNGKHRDRDGVPVECCCDECDYLSECFGDAMV